MIFAVEGTLIERAFLTRRIIVAFDVYIVGVCLAIENAAYLIVVGIERPGPLWTTDPLFQRQVQRLLVSLPIMLCAESFL